MLQIKGKYNTAKVFTDNIEETAYAQILELMNQPWIKDNDVCIMPDVHAGAGCTIGTTMTIKDKIVPNLVGVDIGCGMLVIPLCIDVINFQELDDVIRNKIPCGKAHRSSVLPYVKSFDVHNLIAPVSEDEMLSLGTLGGGNHFIEIDRDEIGSLYLVIHSGSRHLGVSVCNYWQNVAIKECQKMHTKKWETIERLKKEGRQTEIEMALKSMTPSVPKQLSYLEGESFNGYIHDMAIAQNFADLNRLAMANEILNAMCIPILTSEMFTTVHNYIDIDNMILRKGAVSAKYGEHLIIPMNMRDGSLLCTGKGNVDWNHSAPHGAGRVMSRSVAKESVSIEEYKKSMEGIYTTCVNNSTIDESPMAYKPMKEIIANITPTVAINHIIKPIYNFKASE